MGEGVGRVKTRLVSSNAVIGTCNAGLQKRTYRFARSIYSLGACKTVDAASIYSLGTRKTVNASWIYNLRTIKTGVQPSIYSLATWKTVNASSIYSLQRFKTVDARFKTVNARRKTVNETGRTALAQRQCGIADMGRGGDRRGGAELSRVIGRAGGRSTGPSGFAGAWSWDRRSRRRRRGRRIWPVARRRPKPVDRSCCRRSSR